jgi:ribonuclease P protein component
MARVLLRLKRRADFLRARRGKALHARGFAIQAAPRLAPQEAELPASRRPGDSATIDCRGGQAQALQDDVQPRFGFTVSKRCGGAVQRNRIRRRLKEALRLIDPLPARPGYDYVIVARPEALGMAFSDLQAGLLRALGKAVSAESSTVDRDGRIRGPGIPRPRSSKSRTTHI